MIDYKRVKCFNEVVCKNSGQESVIINKNNLMSALSVQQWFQDEKLRAAALFRSLIQNHPFQDGNKRTAVLVLMHVCKPTCTDETLFNVTLKVAVGTLKDPEEISKLLY